MRIATRTAGSIVLSIVLLAGPIAGTALARKSHSTPGGKSSSSLVLVIIDPDDGVPQTDLLPTRVLQVGGAKLIAWVADQEDSRRLGLMHVRSIPDDHGMLFVYPRAGRRSFWMRNTHVPLSLAYVAADGTIEQLVDMQPLDLTSHPSRTSVRLVLEVNQGWFRRNAVEVGTKIPGITELVGYE